MWKRIIGSRIGLAGVLAVLTCFGHAAETLKIGMVAPVTGPAAESGRYEIQGAKLAIEEINKAGGLLSRQIELVVEDDQTTNPGIVLAFSKLAGDNNIPAFIGSVRSTQVHAMAPDIQRIGRPVMIGGTDPQLTQMGNPWLFRCRPNDIYSSRVIAGYGVDTLGKKKWAIIHSTDAFGSNGMKNLAEVLKRTGIEPVLIQGYTNNSQDFTPVALAVKQSGADVMGTYMTFENDEGIFAKQLRQLGVNVDWVGSASTVTATALKLAGPALYGSFAVADFNADSSPAAKKFAAQYEATYKSVPDQFGAWTYDAVHVMALAIDNAKSLEPPKIREAILSIKGYPGAEGIYNFDQNGDGLHGYNIVKNDNGKVVFIKHIDFSD
jgi:branched-chain amino acid transport system substrate-binding protein